MPSDDNLSALLLLTVYMDALAPCRGSDTNKSWGSMHAFEEDHKRAMQFALELYKLKGRSFKKILMRAESEFFALCMSLEHELPEDERDDSNVFGEVSRFSKRPVTLEGLE